jgi:hypothetical protein
MIPNSEKFFESMQGLAFCFLLFLVEQGEKFVRSTKLFFQFLG